MDNVPGCGFLARVTKEVGRKRKDLLSSYAGHREHDHSDTQT